MIRLRSSTVGFKEWSFVCDALGAGRQSIIIRKGGIAEGKGGFQWQASEFLLFPTHYHEQSQSTDWTPSATALEDEKTPDQVILRLAARIEGTASVPDMETALALAPHHVWKEETIRQRFGYGESTGLSVAVLRVFRLPEPRTIPMQPKFGGCRSWVDLPERPLDGLTPVLTDAEHALRVETLRTLFPKAD